MTTLTYKDLQDEFLRRLDEAESGVGSSSSTTRQLAKDMLNSAHRRLVSGRIWPFMLWPVPESFTTSIGVQNYALHSQMGRLLVVYDTNRQIYLPMLARREWPSVGVQMAGNVQTVASYGFIFGPSWPVKVQPVTAQTLSIVSDNGIDNTVGLYVEGRDGSGNFVSETISAAGTAPVNSANTYTYIIAKSKIGTWAGNLTLKAGSTVLDTIAAGSPGQVYPTIELVEPTGDVRTYVYQFQRVVRTLVNDFDLPDIPYPHSEIIFYAALLDMITYNSELANSDAATRWQKAYDELWDGLVRSFSEDITGSYPRFVRDLDASGPSNRVWNYAP